MKRIFTVMSVVALLFVATPSQAQKVQIGLKGGYNLMTPKEEKMMNTKTVPVSSLARLSG